MSTDAAVPLDRLEVLGIEMLARHGVFDEERAQGRRFRVDVVATLGTRLRAFSSDQLGDTVDYGRIATIVHEVLSGPACHLVERLAERIAERSLQLPSVVRVEVVVHKHAHDVPGDPQWVGVRIVRVR